MKRKRLQSSSSTRKRLNKRHLEVTDRASTVDPEEEDPRRTPPTLMKIGPKKLFKSWDLRKLPNIARVYDTAYIAVFSGAGYVDFDTCSDKASAQRVVSMFQLRYPRMKVEWLKGERDATFDNAVRDSKRKPLLQRKSQSKRKRLSKS